MAGTAAAAARDPAGLNTWALSVVLVTLVWGWLGWSDLADRAEAGFRTDGDLRVISVESASAAEIAGILPGDRLQEIEGVALKTTADLARLPPARASQQRRVVLQRDGETMDLQLTYRALDERAQQRSRVKALVGAVFLLAPLLPLLRHGQLPARLLFVLGLGISLAFLPAPLINSFAERALVQVIVQGFVWFGLAALLHFLLVFPQASPVAGKPYLRWLVYGPMLLLWLMLALRMLQFTDIGPVLNSFIRMATVVVVVAYLLLAAFRVLRNYSRTDRSLRRELALNGMLWGTVLGVVPALLALMIAIFSPAANPPGQAYWFVSLALLPILWSRSVWRLG